MMFVICGLVVIFMIMLLSCQYNSRGSGLMSSVVESPGRLHSKSVSHVYPHPRWRPKGAFVSAKAVYESDRVSIEEHSVRLSDAAAYASDAESGADKANVVHNWIWVNQPDQINALVYLGDRDELATSLLHSNNPTASKDDPLASYSALLNVPVLSSTSNTGDYPTLTQWLQKVQTTATQASSTQPPERLFLMFRQRKYGYEGHSLAVVGGAVDMIDRGSPVAAAQRELLEELGIVDCPAMDVTISNTNDNGVGLSGNNNNKKRHGIIHLGGYRSDTNRGGGVVYSFVAARCPLSANASFVAVPNYKRTSDGVVSKKKNGNEKSGSVPPKFVMQSADGDLESQGVVLVTQSYLNEGMINNHRNEEVGMQGVVKEVKWAATVAMAILRLTGLGI